MEVYYYVRINFSLYAPANYFFYNFIGPCNKRSMGFKRLFYGNYEESVTRHQESLDLINKLDQKLDDWRNNVNHKLDMFEKDLNMLIESDKNDIKQAIVRDYHIFTKKGWIDDFSLDTILLRYNDYKIEGGNTYIDTLVSELRSLPKIPPQ